MQQLQLIAHGEPSDVIELKTVPEPALGQDDVLMLMEAAPLNPSDFLFVRGMYGVRPAFPSSVGAEGVGRVAKIGSKVDVALQGKRVLILPTYEQGTWADEVVVPVRNIVPMSDEADPIFDEFYGDDIEVSSEASEEPIRGKARVRAILANFLVPLHVMAEVGGLSISIRETAIPGDVADETHSAWTVELVGVSGRTCTLNWCTLRKWSELRVVYEHHYDEQQSGGPLTFDDLSLGATTPAASSE
jgi:hypothetical protein